MTQPRPARLRLTRPRPTRPPGRALTALFAVTAATLPLAVVGPAAAAPTAAEGLAVSVAPTSVAGEPVRVEVTGAASGSRLDVLAVGSFGSTVLSADADTGVAAFDLPAAITAAAGTLDLTAWSGDATGAASVRIEPGPAAPPVETVVGARSIVADGADVSMAVVVPVDAQGNAVAAGTPVTISRTTPTGALESIGTTTSGLLAWADLRSGTTAGAGSVWATLDDGSTGPATTLLEVPGRPAPFTLAVADSTEVGSAGGGALDPARATGAGPTGAADGRSLTPVVTSVLADAFGNVLEDGTSVTLDWTGPDGAGRSAAVTMGGVARFSLPAPSATGDVTLTAHSRGIASSPLTLAFAAVVDDVPVTVAAASGVAAVAIGPVVGLAGSYLADGTPYRVEFPGSGLADRQGRLYEGTAQLDIPLTDVSPGALTVRVSVLGAVGEATADIRPDREDDR